MTRFARAKGSKASNERIPEPATPWREMKEQLVNKNKEKEMSEKKKEADEKRTKTYENFLKEKQEEEAQNVKWAEFPGIHTKPKKILNGNKEVFENGSLVKKEKGSGSRKRNLESTDDESDDDDDDEEFQALKRQIEERLRKEIDKTVDESDEEPPEESSAKIEVKDPVIKKHKTKRVKLSISVNNRESSQKTTEVVEERKEKKPKNQKLKEKQMQETEASETPKSTPNKKEKKGKQENSQTADNESEIVRETPEDIARRKHERKLEKRKRQKLKKKQALEENPEIKNTEKLKKLKEKRKQKRLELKEKKKAEVAVKTNQKEGAEVRNEKPLVRERPSKLENCIINGQKVQLANFQGFSVKKEDYDRLVELEKEMRIKGIPRNEIKHALKLERRRAEKALARMKKRVCFHCRMSGHSVAECPKVGETNETNVIHSGICFKCGSTEHTHFNCKVVRGDDYKYATCYICNEQGHISRQCPDNNRGLYPRGGACRVCGDVTHLKKDCPKYQMQKEQSSVVADVMDNGDVEGLEEERKSASSKKKKSTNIVKF